MTIENKISIVMPAYNSELYIKEAIDSVINQSYTNWELLITDDGSTDNTGKIIDLYALKDNRIKVFHTSNFGLSHARNIGLDNSTGEWIAFLDSDDFLPSDALEKMINNSKDCDMVIGNFINFSDSEETIVEKRIKGNQSYPNSYKLAYEFKDTLFILLFSGILSKLIRRKVIVEKFCDDCYFAEDILFFANLFKHLGKINLITDNLYYYRIGNMNSLVHQFAKKDFSVFEKTTNIYLDLFDDKEIRRKLYSFYLHYVIKKINTFFDDNNLTDKDRKQAIASLLNNDLLNKIPFDNYCLLSKGKRLAFTILIGDIDFIMLEFKRLHSKKN